MSYVPPGVIVTLHLTDTALSSDVIVNSSNNQHNVNNNTPPDITILYVMGASDLNAIGKYIWNNGTYYNTGFYNTGTIYKIIQQEGTDNWQILDGNNSPIYEATTLVSSHWNNIALSGHEYGMTTDITYVGYLVAAGPGDESNAYSVDGVYYFSATLSGGAGRTIFSMTEQSPNFNTAGAGPLSMPVYLQQRAGDGLWDFYDAAGPFEIFLGNSAGDVLDVTSWTDIVLAGLSYDNTILTVTDYRAVPT